MGLKAQGYQCDIISLRFIYFSLKDLQRVMDRALPSLDHSPNGNNG